MDKEVNSQEWKNIGYARIYWNSFNEFDLKITEVVLLSLIWSLSRSKHSKYWCYASRQYLAKSIRVTRPTIDKNLKLLKKKGLIVFAPKKTSQGVVQVKPSMLWDNFAEQINNELEQRKKARNEEPLL